MRQFILVIVAIAVLMPAITQASSVVVEPKLVNRAIRKGGVFDELQVRLTNNSDDMEFVYAHVHNIDIGGASQFVNKSGLSRSESLANWVFITRGQIELPPKKATNVPLRVSVATAAVPGSYYAVVFFDNIGYDDVNRMPPIGSDNLMLLNILVKTDSVTIATLSSFRQTKRIFFKPPIGLQFDFKNEGNTDVVMQGELVVFNSLGAEIDTIPINAEKFATEAGKDGSVVFEWFPPTKIAKYKAVLLAKYGKDQLIQDTLFVWYIPKMIMVSILFFLILWLIGYVYVQKLNDEKSEEKNWKKKSDESFVHRHPLMRSPHMNKRLMRQMRDVRQPKI